MLLEAGYPEGDDLPQSLKSLVIANLGSSAPKCVIQVSLHVDEKVGDRSLSFLKAIEAMTGSPTAGLILPLVDNGIKDQIKRHSLS
jgi:hypothetical protein